MDKLTALRFYFYLLLCATLVAPAAFAASVPAPAPLSGPRSTSLLALRPAQIEQVTGKKMTLLKKIQLKVLQRKLRKAEEEQLTPRQERQAKWSLILGLGGLVLLFIPFVSFIAIPAAIVAIVLGAKSLEGNSNTKGIIGIIAGGLTLLLLIVAVLVLVAFFAGFN